MRLTHAFWIYPLIDAHLKRPEAAEAFRVFAEKARAQFCADQLDTLVRKLCGDRAFAATTAFLYNDCYIGASVNLFT